MQDGIYFEVFAVKDGVRYNAKIVDMTTLSLELTNSLLNGINNIILLGATPTEKGGE